MHGIKSATLEIANSRITFLKSRDQAEKNELQLGLLVRLLKLQIFRYFFVASRTQS